MPTMTIKSEEEPSAPQSRGTRRPLLPYTPRRVQVTGQEDKTQALWPWYFVPFREPDVSPECKAFVLGEYEPEGDEERQLLLSELTMAMTLRGDANMAIVQAPGACSSLRQDYATKGMQLITPTTGEASGGPPLQLFEPQLTSGHMVGRTLTDPYIGITEVLADLEVRRKWVLAQLDAKIEDSMERSKDGESETRRYMRAVVGALRRRRQLIANGLPTVKELSLFFKRFELQRLESQQDQRMKEQQALQGRIDDQSQQIARLASEVQAAVWGGEAMNEPAN